MNRIKTQIQQVGLMPMVVLQDAQDAVPLAKALYEGGIGIAEVTFRTPAAAEAIERIAKEVPQVLVGAGTVHTPEQAQAAVDAGARFIVTPGFNPEVVEWCVKQDVFVLPGISAPADLEKALGFGLAACKFFPAGAAGGIDMLKALFGPYADMQFLPTGGVGLDNMNDYLKLPNVIAVGGSFMAPQKLIANKDWAGITAVCREVIRRQMGFELLHVGINTKDADDAKTTATRLGSLFMQEVSEFPGAYFAGGMAEIIKGTYLGKHGHIAIRTNDIDRAVFYFERIGVEMDHSTAVKDAQGNTIAIYFKEEVGGFALHLRRR